MNLSLRWRTLAPILGFASATWVAFAAVASGQVVHGPVSRHVHVQPDPASVEDPESSEVIRDRYPNGKIKIERHVTQDLDENYVNHGRWAIWDENGRLLAEGVYRQGQRHGLWTQHIKSHAGEILSSPHGKQFQPPFYSEATFSDDQLDGEWIIMDARERTVIRWSFANGKRNGTSIWWHANGQKWREVNYRNGELDGISMEWKPDQTLLSKEDYQEGHRIGTKIEWHAPGVKKLEAHYRFAKRTTEVVDDWWTGTSQTRTLGKEAGPDSRHGRWLAWHPNGQIAVEGEYQNDQPVGKFVWWYANLQKASQGTYVDGHPTGHWTWWYPTGQKKMLGDYAEGIQVGKWIAWDEQGKVAESLVISDVGESGEVATTSSPSLDFPTVAPELPAAPDSSSTMVPASNARR